MADLQTQRLELNYIIPEVLELKFTGRFPYWMRELVEVFGLKTCSAAKYVDGIVRIKECIDAPMMPAIDNRRHAKTLRRSEPLWA